MTGGGSDDRCGQASTSEQAKPAVGSVAVKLDPWQKALALVLMFLTFAFGSYLAYKNYNGVGTAAVFAVALILLIVGFGGVLPTNVKVGDVEVAIQQARQEGASAVASVPDAPDSKAAAQQVKQAHPELAPQVDRMQDAMQEARKEGASVVASGHWLRTQRRPPSK
jgi:hypothetical protein